MINKIYILISLLVVVWSCNEKMPSDNHTSKVTTITKTEKDTPGVSASTANQVNAGAPSYMKLDLKGYKTDSINLSEYYGEVVFLNHWGSWCPPCRAEMPSIQKLYDKYGDKVKFVTIATEKKANAYKDFLSSNNYTFPVYEPNGPMASEIKPRGFPTTIIFNKKGEIVVSDVGAADWNSDQVHERLDKLLSE